MFLGRLRSPFFVGVHRSAAYKAIDEGRLKAVEIAGRKFVSRDEARRWKREREREGCRRSQK